MLLPFFLGCMLNFLGECWNTCSQLCFSSECFTLSRLVGLVHQQCQAQLTTCVTCTSCQDAYDGTDRNVSCSATTTNANSCQKIRMQLPGTTMVFKACSSSCREQSIIAGPVRFDVTCCSSNNCNGAVAVRLQLALLVLSCLLLFIHGYSQPRPTNPLNK